MNYYELLGIKENATEEEIKEAYKKQIKKWHPDINKDPEAINISMKINEAKDVLLDENKRKEYDYSLKEEKDRVYNKYSNNKSKTTNENTETYADTKKEDKGLTKWEYLKEYLKYSKAGGFRKILAVFFVLLESLFCTILKFLIIGLALICFYISDFIMMVYYYLYPFIIGYLILVITIWVFKGNTFMFKENVKLVYSIFVILGTFLSSFLLIIAGNLLISKRVFNFLYNKLDVTLFKWAVGYKH